MAASGATNIIAPNGSAHSERGGHTRQDSNATARDMGHQRMSSMGKGSGAMVYGIVQYDFNAERPDELDAKAGEAIIVIAQSNPEWFVAKPIGRLGGPGLIPVSFIEIRDMTTGDAVSDAQGAVARAGVPKVEEWKKMAADYKNSSITLGKFEVANATTLQRDLGRISLHNGNNPHGSPHEVGSYVSCYVCFQRFCRGVVFLTAPGTCSGLPPKKWQQSHPGCLPSRIATQLVGARVRFHSTILL